MQSQGTPWWLTRGGTGWIPPSETQQPASEPSQGSTDSAENAPAVTSIDQMKTTAVRDAAGPKGPGGRDIVNLPTPPLTPEVNLSERELQEALWHGTFTSASGELERVHAEGYQSLCLLRATEPGSGSLKDCFARKPGSEVPE